MTATRRLAAILAADVAGYSRLIGADEGGTLQALKTIRAELLDPTIAAHNGRLVKTTGDGLLVEFGSVVDALRCAAEVQAGMAKRSATVPADRRIQFRIGLHQGDVVIEDGDIFGDSVNVAARLEALAEPGGICVSARVRGDAVGKLDLAFEDMGQQQLKNITRPVRAYAVRVAASHKPSPRRRIGISGLVATACILAVAVIGTAAWWAWPRLSVPAITAQALPTASAPAASVDAKPAPRLSIVVLPFANLSNDPEQQYFADGITEDLTTDLSRIRDSFVISRNTAFTYRNKSVDTRQIGRELGVRYVLEGSLRREGNKLRVNAQLIDAGTDAHLWAERFDGDTGDLFALQNEITSRIAIGLNVELTSREAVRPADNPDALDYILRARAAYWKPNSNSGEKFAETARLYAQALALDPHSVEAQSQLANMLAVRAGNQWSDSPAADFSRAEELVGQALAAAPRDWLAHFAKGAVLRWQGRCEDAIPEFETALALNPNWLNSLDQLAWCKLLTGSIGEAIPLEEQIIRLSPRDPYIYNFYFMIGLVHLLQSRTDEAVAWFEKARSANPGLPPHGYLASAYALKGETERAAAELTEARRLYDRYSSIERLKAAGTLGGPGYWGVPKIAALYEATYFAGLRKAGLPEE
jgi:adenylate cyclase